MKIGQLVERGHADNTVILQAYFIISLRKETGLKVT
jgi:hypothetical protein